jgi:CO/xanthine dehydrogenase Mo-binding subunit
MGFMLAVGAIGNAIFDTTDVCIRRAPLTPDRVLATLKRGPK